MRRADKGQGEPLRSLRETEVVLECANEMFSYYDPELRVKWANRAFVQTMGLEGQQIIGRRCYELLHGRSSPCEGCPVLRAVQSGRPQEGESSTADGKHWLLRGYPVLEADGRVSGVVELGMDITERKRSDAELRRREEEFRTLFEHSPTSIWIEDYSAVKAFLDQAAPQHRGEVRSWLRAHPEQIARCLRLIRVLDVNQATVELHGAAGKRELLRGLDRILGPEAFESFAEQLARLHEGQKSFQLETVNRTLAGERKEMLLGIAVMPGHEQALDKVLVELQDITDRKKAEKALQDREELLRMVTDSLPVLIAYLDSGLRFRFVNHTYEQWYRRGKEKIVGTTLAELVGEARFRELQAELSKGLAGQPVSFEGEYAFPDGERRRVQSTVIPHRGADGRVEGLFGLVEDITERKTAEERRQKLEEQLYQAQKMESVGRLAGGVAHDFNNLLTSIIGNAELALHNSSPAAPARADLQEILKAAERAAVLTRQLLAFSRKQAIEPKIVDLNALILGMQAMLRRLIGETVELETQLAEGLQPARIDAGQLEQVLTNLVVNARDALAPGGRISIRTQNVVLDPEEAGLQAGITPGPYVLISVVDNGAGMDETVKAHLFEPFFTTKEKGKGTGLGLSTCYGIVRLHGGQIRLASEPGQGTTARVYLPAAAGPAQSAAAPEARPVSRGRETILLVEDEEAVRKMVQRALAGSGFTVLEAANGREALRVAESCGTPIDLLLTDVVMPHMGGRELAESLRRRHPELRILFMSGYTEDSLFRQGEAEGMALIHKPFSASALSRRVREMLDRR